MLHVYDRTLTGVLRHQRFTMIISVLLLVVTLFLLGIIPKGFLPSEDTGSIFTFTEAAQGISFEAMVKAAKGVGGHCRPKPLREELDVQRRGQRP